MRTRQLLDAGVPHSLISLARRAVIEAAHGGLKKRALKDAVSNVVADPNAYLEDERFAALASGLIAEAQENTSADTDVKPLSGRTNAVEFRQWGSDLDPQAVDQMYNACRLPVSVRGALMPDAHLGYGLPIGGVLATENAVIPYAVGVDIACRVKMTVLDIPVKQLDKRQDRLRDCLEKETRFGIGSHFKSRRKHDVMDEDWSVSPVTREKKDKAWAQLGTSGSGNHFVEYGIFSTEDAALGIEPGEYLAILSHSGSRGVGAAVCNQYSKIARQNLRGLAKELKQLAWLDLSSQEGAEYWAAMELMGKYASANHECIHLHMAKTLGAEVLLDVENHHNFAWKEVHDGKEVVVHRKGATPASKGTLGLIPGTMATPAYLVRGLGNAESLNSAAHGAGRAMSRTRAKKTLHWKEANAFLQEKGVTLISAGLDEVPMVYKDINAVMEAQRDLVEPIGRFAPKLVKMAPAGERPED